MSWNWKDFTLVDFVEDNIYGVSDWEEFFKENEELIKSISNIIDEVDEEHLKPEILELFQPFLRVNCSSIKIILLKREIDSHEKGIAYNYNKHVLSEMNTQKQMKDIIPLGLFPWAITPMINSSETDNVTFSCCWKLFSIKLLQFINSKCKILVTIILDGSIEYFSRYIVKTKDRLFIKGVEPTTDNVNKGLFKGMNIFKTANNFIENKGVTKVDF